MSQPAHRPLARNKRPLLPDNANARESRPASSAGYDAERYHWPSVGVGLRVVLELNSHTAEQAADEAGVTRGQMRWALGGNALSEDAFNKICTYMAREPAEFEHPEVG